MATARDLDGLRSLRRPANGVALALEEALVRDHAEALEGVRVGHDVVGVLRVLTDDDVASDVQRDDRGVLHALEHGIAQKAGGRLEGVGHPGHDDLRLIGILAQRRDERLVVRDAGVAEPGKQRLWVGFACGDAVFVLVGLLPDALRAADVLAVLCVGECRLASDGGKLVALAVGGGGGSDAAGNHAAEHLIRADERV